MNSIIFISCFLVASGYATLLGVPHVTTTQYHSQDELGQYSYGYSGGPSAKEETRTADGITRGSYSYVDANGIVQSTSYVSDPIHGFRVAATNLPRAPSPVVSPTVVAAPPVVPAYVRPVPAAVPAYVHSAPAAVPAAPGFDYVNGVPLETPEVAAAKAAHFAAHGEAIARLARRWKRSLAPVGKSYSYVTPSGSTTVVADSPTGKSFSYSTVASAPIASPVVYSPPVAVVSAPAVTTYAAPIVAVGAPQSSHYQAQNHFGGYSYGYSDGLSSKTESRTADGVTYGKYSYLDSNGIIQTVKYVADAGGFRVHATNLPVAHTA